MSSAQSKSDQISDPLVFSYDKNVAETSNSSVAFAGYVVRNKVSAGSTSNVQIEDQGLQFRALHPKVADSARCASINGVVDEVADNRVVISCHTPSGSVRLALHRDIVPNELARYAEPVSVRATMKDGFRTFEVVSRVVANPVAIPQYLQDWLDQ